MPKVLKFVLAGVAGVLVLLAAGIAFFAATFNPDDYKALLVDRVKADTQRTLAIPGRIGLTLFPRLGVRLGEVTLSEPGSDKRFASISSARVALALMPLLQRQVVIDRVEIAGLQAQVTRFKDGRTSVDDLLQPGSAPGGTQAPEPAASASPLHFDAAGISITSATLAFDDQQAGRRLELAGADIQVGRITPGQPGELKFKGRVKSSNPIVDATVTLAGRFLLEPDKRHYAFSGLSAEAAGRLADFSDATFKLAGQADVKLEPLALDVSGVTATLSGKTAQGTLDASIGVPQLQLAGDVLRAQKAGAQATLKGGPRTVSLSLALPDFNGKAGAFRLPGLGVEMSITDGPLNAKAKLTGEVDGNTDALVFSSPQSKLVFEGRQADQAIQGSVAAPWTVDLKKHLATLPRITIDGVLPNPRGGTLKLAAQGSATLHLDTLRADAALAGTLDESRFDAKAGWNAPGIRFDVSIDRIDADRYRKTTAAAAAPPKEGAPAADVPLDFGGLRDLNAQGSLKIGALQAAGLKLAQLRVDLKAAGGRLELAPLSAELYQGRSSGSLVLVATGTPRIALKQDLQQVSLGPLLKDLLQRDSLEGRGDVALDINAQGASVQALLTALNGSARLALKDGAVRGFNIAQAIRGTKARLGLGGGAQTGTGTGSRNETTDFSEMGGSFRIERGVAHTEDLQAKSPLLRVGAVGDVDLGNSRLDVTVRATVVPTLQGQGGPELQALRGQTVPVKLSGPFTAVGWKIDFAGLVEDLAKQKLDEKAAAVKDKAKEQLGNKLKGLLGR